MISSTDDYHVGRKRIANMTILNEDNNNGLNDDDDDDNGDWHLRICS